MYRSIALLNNDTRNLFLCFLHRIINTNVVNSGKFFKLNHSERIKKRDKDVETYRMPLQIMAESCLRVEIKK